jgi:subtilase family serine protease
MRLHSLTAGILFLGALTMTSFSQTRVSKVSTAMHVETLGAADQNSVTHFNVYLPLTHQDVLEKLLRDQTDTASPSYHHWLTPAQFKAQFGPSRADVAKATAVLKASGLKVVSEKTQSLQVEGPIWAVQNMFTTHLQRVQMEKGRIKIAAAEKHLTMPEALASLGAVIPEFVPRKPAHVHSERMARPLSSAYPLTRLSSNDSFFYPNDLNEAYQLPSFKTETTLARSGHKAQLVGLGAHIGIVISSVIDPADLASTFNSTLNLGGGASLIQNYSGNTSVPAPTVTIRAIDGGSGAFNPATDDAFEASLDTQMSLGTAPGAKETIYNIPDLYDDSILDGYAAIDEDNVVDVVSSSFGGCELYYTAAYNGGVDYTPILATYHSLFEQGNAQGITFVASSGDNGAVPCLSADFFNYGSSGTSYVPGVETPAADPSVTAVGGTNLTTVALPGVDDATYSMENANFDPRLPAEYLVGPNTVASVDNNTWGSGGGFSTIFAKPWYQNLVKTGSKTARAVPDVSLMMGGCPGDADLSKQDCTVLPRSAAIIWVAGEPDLLIGTSSSSPELAGVIALAVELNNGRLGNVNPEIYGMSALQTLLGGAKAPKEAQFFHRTVWGSNNFYTVQPGQAFSEVLGNGTLDVTKLLLLESAKAAGTPNTPSNP